jgi:MoaA/NifB/PqqE/SkfB family radical SAM enzyme
MTFTLADQIRLFGYLAYDSLRGNPPRRASLQMTEACNLRCKMCTFWQYDGPTPSVDRLKAVVLALKDLGIKHINLWGGEPFLHDDIVEIFRFIKAHRFRLGIITNGTRIDAAKMEGAVEYLDEITFSVDSPHAAVHDRIRGSKGSHAIIQETILELLRRRGDRRRPELTIDCTVQKDNIDHVHEMVEFAERYGADVQFDPAQIQGYGNRLNHAVLKIPAELRWAAVARLKQMSASGKRINSSGNLEIMDAYLAGRDIRTPCFFPYIGLLVNPWGEIVYCWGWDKKMGNVLDGDFRARWRSAEYRELREQTLKCRMDRCKSCGFSMVRWPDAPGYQMLSALFGVRIALGKG